jgi:AsmA protein
MSIVPAGEPQPAPVSRRLGKRSIPAILVALLLVGIFVPPFINVSRYRIRIAEAISRALGRPVTVGGISLRLLPQPGFDLANLVVGDDPAFGYEPILRADEVTASLRLSSLWRGQLEIAQLRLKYPSLNLVRNADGQWNLESLLWRASRTETAPTMAAPQRRPRFPYIEAESGRINFKFGEEKTAFALTEADFKLWSPAENEWRTHLEAKPFRSDVPINDTGILRADGSFRRAELLRDVPIEMRLNWSNGQLGQITKLIYGRDRGWRGGVQLNLLLEGTASALRVTGTTSVREFQRYDISGGEPLRLDAKCSGIFHVEDKAIHDLDCQMPFERGSAKVTGEVTVAKLRPYNLVLTVKDIPANAVARLLRHAKADLPNDLSAAGVFDASFNGHRAEGDSEGKWSGTGEGTGVVVHSATLGKNLELGTVRFSTGLAARSVRKRSLALPVEQVRKSTPARAESAVGGNPRINFESFSIPLGGTTVASASGWISSQGYSLQVQGDAELARLLQVARATGIAGPRFGLFGAAKLDIALSGDWVGFAKVRAFGRAQIRSARAEVPGIAGPVLIQSAQVELADNQVLFHDLTAQIGKSIFTGEAQFPRRCDDAAPCASRFDVQADTINVEELNTLLNPRIKRQPWYKFFGSGGEASALARMRASGKLAIKRLLLGRLTATQVSAEFALDSGRLALSRTRAELLGGSESGQWQADFSGDEPVYSGSGVVANIAAGQLAGLTHAALGTGTMNAAYQIKMNGWTRRELWSSANAAADFDWRNGSWHNVQLGRTPLQFSDFAGHIALGNGRFQISTSKMRSGGGTYALIGTIEGDELALQFEGDKGATYSLRGTLQKPLVVMPPATEASLKP